MSRQQIVAGNWKMNKSFDEGLALANSLLQEAPNNGATVVLGTPFIHLMAVSELLKDSPFMHVAAQNCHQEDSGAYTGETSVSMLKSVGATYVILGHSERRAYFKEDNALLAAKVNKALEAGLKPIFCCGEPLEIREAETHVAFVKQQLEESLFHLTSEQFSQIVIAYEPIWAIGTGLTASPEQAQDMHREIRQSLAAKFGQEAADSCSILYGGSVKPANAADLFSQADVDGGLVGGASLKAADFVAIIGACSQ